MKGTPMQRVAIAWQLLAYLIQRDWWLAPAAAALVLLALFITLAQSSVVAPLLYPLF